MEPLAWCALGIKKTIRAIAEAAAALITDAAEQPIQRPHRKQRRWYSGKQRGHSSKNEITVIGIGKIVSVSDSVQGHVRDCAWRKRGSPLPEGSRAYAASGYQGLQEGSPDTEVPFKKTKNHTHAVRVYATS